VEKNLIDLVGAHQKLGKGAVATLDGDSGLDQVGTEQRKRFVEAGVQIGGDAIARGARKMQEVTDDANGSIGAAANDAGNSVEVLERRIEIELAADPGKLGPAFGREALLGFSIRLDHSADFGGAVGERFDRSCDGVEGIVDLVRHSGHQLPEA